MSTDINSLELCFPKQLVDVLSRISKDDGDIMVNGDASTSLQGDTETAPLATPCRLKFRTDCETIRWKIDGLKLNILENSLGCVISNLNLQNNTTSGNAYFGSIFVTSVGNGAENTRQSTSSQTIAPLSDNSRSKEESLVDTCTNDKPTPGTNDTKEKLPNSPPPVQVLATVKRKRGRPRKVKANEQESGTEQICTTSLNSQIPDKTADSGRRYSLRGAKIRREIMDAERNGSDEECEFGKSSAGVEKIESGLVETDKSNLHKADNRTMHVNESSQVSWSHTKEPRTEKTDIYGVAPKPQRRKRNNVRVAGCKFCSKMFCDFTGVEEHVRKFHSSEGDFECYISELQELKVVKCLKCDLTFKHRYALQLHEDSVHCEHAGSSCSICGKKFRSLKSLRLHVRFVHNSSATPHLCHLCPAKFKWTNTLKQHIQEIHLGLQNFSCSHCGKKFARKGQLNRHMRIHGFDSSKRILCNLCGKGFWFETNYQRHKESVHQVQKEKFHCSYCGKGFAQKNSMVSHVRLIHFKLYPFFCKKCNCSFARSKLLEEHMKTAHCENSFRAGNARRRRFKYNRTPDDLFYCTYCSSSFFYKSKMVEHIHKAHAKDFPYVCMTCDQGFLLKSYLKKHRKEAHGVTDQISQKTNDSSEDENSEATNQVVTLSRTEPITASDAGCVVDSVTHQEAAEASFVISQNFDLDEFELDDAAAAASLLVEVASGNLTTTHYVIQSQEQSEVPNEEKATEIFETFSQDQSDNIVQIITADNGETQVVLPRNLDGSNLELVESTEETVSSSMDVTENVSALPEYVEDTVILSDHNLQFEDNMHSDVPLNVVVVESES